MDSKKLNDWLQVAGLFGVVAGLIFVGLQLSLDRIVAVADVFDALTHDRPYKQAWPLEQAVRIRTGETGEEAI